MERSGVNGKGLSALTGISEPSITHYRGGRVPKAEELYRLAKHFGVTMEWLLVGEAAGDGTPVVRELAGEVKVLDAIKQAEKLLESLEAMRAGPDQSSRGKTKYSKIKKSAIFEGDNKGNINIE